MSDSAVSASYGQQIDSPPQKPPAESPKKFYTVLIVADKKPTVNEFDKIDNVASYLKGIAKTYRDDVVRAFIFYGEKLEIAKKGAERYLYWPGSVGEWRLFDHSDVTALDIDSEGMLTSPAPPPEVDPDYLQATQDEPDLNGPEDSEDDLEEEENADENDS
jgi:hypothetical protein